MISGFFAITVSGHAPNYTTGITLVRDTEWVGGLAFRVMGWTGPLGQGTSPYTKVGVFPGHYLKNIHNTLESKGVKARKIIFLACPLRHSTAAERMRWTTGSAPWSNRSTGTGPASPTRRHV